MSAGAAASRGPAAVRRLLQSPAAYAALESRADVALDAALEAAPSAVETVETHMSWVFLAGKHVLKQKKAVRHDFLDFSTLAAREACCREELRLNARLAPGVYRGLVALQWQAGQLMLTPEHALADCGEVVEWLVWMRRLPAACMLDHAIASRSLQAREIDALADVLVDFFRRATPAEVPPADYLARLHRQQALTRDMLLRPALQVDGAAEALGRLDEALQCQHDALAQRASRRRIVDGHGDLRPEHVCLLQPPVVIDCIEFNATLRQTDPFDELAFLAMECGVAGARWAGPRLIARCAAGLDDSPPPAVLQVYTASRALLRARLSLAHLLDARPRTPERWRPQAQRYVTCACQALDAFECGGSGLSAARPRGFP